MNKIYFIVESPNKIKKIKQILNECSDELNSKFEIYATMGHFRDLTTNSKYNLGINFDSHASYKSVNGIFEYNKKNFFCSKINFFKKMNKSIFYLATDPDREGEAIAWHLIDTLGFNKHQYYRVKYQSITKDEILNAIKNRSFIDMNLVNAQLSRRFIDRIVGWLVSPLVQKHCNVPSAGRVQSIVIQLIMERNLEIEYFVPDTYYHIYGNFHNTNKLFKLKSTTPIDNEKKLYFMNLIEKSFHKDFTYIIEEKDENIYPKQPFITSTIQRECYTIYRWNVKKTMLLLQILFENGYITYHRTDSYFINEKEQNIIKNYIIKEFGSEFSYKRNYKNKQNSQEAHECIRPTNIYTGNKLIKIDNEECQKLYELIWKRTIMSQMSNGIDWIINEICKCVIDNIELEFMNTTKGIKSLGYRILEPNLITEKKYQPLMNNNSITKLLNVEVKEYQTQPPPKYNQSSLIKKMEDEEIGRPSTYAYIVEKILSMNMFNNQYEYINQDKCESYINYLKDNFDKSFMNIEYTRNMEKDLDKISNGELDHNQYVIDFYQNINNIINKK